MRGRMVSSVITFHQLVRLRLVGEIVEILWAKEYDTKSLSFFQEHKNWIKLENWIFQNCIFQDTSL